MVPAPFSGAGQPCRFRRHIASPARPEPRSSRVEGSGTGGASVMLTLSSPTSYCVMEPKSTVTLEAVEWNTSDFVTQTRQ